MRGQMHVAINELERALDSDPPLPPTDKASARRLLAKLHQLGIDPPGTVMAAGLFTGKTFVLTGTLPTMKREEAEQKILAAGGKVIVAGAVKGRGKARGNRRRPK